MMAAEGDSLRLGDQLCFSLYVCSKEIVRRYKPFLSDIGLTYTQYITMMVLWEQKRIKVHELGKFLYLDSGTLTPLLKLLEKDGLVVRERNSDDERVVYVSLTKKGEKLKEKAMSVPQKICSCVNLTPEDRENLKKSLEKLLEKLSE
ncbi:MarR family winged helix-turn-helix transcriptional regulator [Treponema sp. Marseille-Q3903]|uniref:MarR family winged helix-turn-helix transcriptional regulator n=1 Tax=Treponema sp. Marseille-Q3903 TaxID=2766703 RepID=UPI001CA3007C|nr:MarR family transcriptional regulator [Treponema sp. Marseille-Q3903]